MVTIEEIEHRRRELQSSKTLRGLYERLEARAARVLAAPPTIPAMKAILSADGGLCPADGTVLTFDPVSPSSHQCPVCGNAYSGERHDQWWARHQHLWLAERAAEMATVAALGEKPDLARGAAALLTEYARRYLTYPNRDNVLGPSRLFSSTYAESMWVLNYLSAAWMLRECGSLDEPTSAAVHQVADEAANLIGEFDEGFSNRQTWNNAALIAIAVWFEDEDLAKRAIEGETGLLAHLRGYRTDGLWYEGENYHLFAMRGLITGLGWAHDAGIDVEGDEALRGRIETILLAPSFSALPDLTFPARKDSRFGVSLAQPMYLDTWEVAFGRTESEEGRRWLTALYGAVPQPQQLFESYLHDAPYENAPVTPARDGLSWAALLEMSPDPAPAEPWKGRSALLQDQGLAVFRDGTRYVSLECGPTGGGHGHPDRLHLTVHQDGVHWLPDFGTGSYLTPDLPWYRSTLAHNAPRLDGDSQPNWDAVCEMFDVQEEWAWTRGRADVFTRTVVVGPTYILDLMELDAAGNHRTELPWHLLGDVTMSTPGSWDPATFDAPFVTKAEQFAPGVRDPISLEARSGEAALAIRMAADGQLLRLTALGAPGTRRPSSFYVVRRDGDGARFVTVISREPIIKMVLSGDVIEVVQHGGTDTHRRHLDGWNVDTPKGRIALRGMRDRIERPRAFLDLEPPPRAEGAALRLDASPALDGTLVGFDPSEPLVLELEDQYRRSEEPYGGPDDFNARAYVGWEEGTLYLAVEVHKPDVLFRPANAPPLLLDNDPDDIHSDGLQVYIRMPEDPAVHGYLIVPAAGGKLRVHGAGETKGLASEVHGAWSETDTGYRVTVAISAADFARAHVGAHVGFDLLVNEMLPGRVRRAGQLVWSGGGGWVWLRGDRQEPDRLGTLELVG